MSVGDYRFQEKCEDRINKMIEQGITIILVSHSIDMIKRLCTKVVWLDHGQIKDIGAIDKVCNEYEK